MDFTKSGSDFVCIQTTKHRLCHAFGKELSAGNGAGMSFTEPRVTFDKVEPCDVADLTCCREGASPHPATRMVLALYNFVGAQGVHAETFSRFDFGASSVASSSTGTGNKMVSS